MTTKVYTPDQETVEIGGRTFTITAWPAMDGLDIQSRVENELTGTGKLSGALIKDMILKSVSVDNIAIADEKKFNQTFARKYKDLMELVAKMLAFNFGDLEDGDDSEGPKEESGTSA